MKKLFDTEILHEWHQFPARDYTSPVSGMVYNREKLPTCGMPLGGIATGCIDIDARGVYGMNNLFNPGYNAPDMEHFWIARSPASMEPLFGLSVGGRTWVLADQTIVDGGEFLAKADLVGQCLSKFSEKNYRKDAEGDITVLPPIRGVCATDDIKYWGHFPVLDMVFETGAPVKTAARCWSSMLPGDALDSNIPGAVFELILSNETEALQEGCIAFHFPGPPPKEARSTDFVRREVCEEFHGMLVSTPDGQTQYMVGVLDGDRARFGGGLSPWNHNWPRDAGWKDIGEALPDFSYRDQNGLCFSMDSATSCAVDFSLRAGESRTVRFFLTWYAPNLLGGTRLRLTAEDELNPNLCINKLKWHGSDYDDKHVFTHMYAARYGAAADAARDLSARYPGLYKRVIAWQEAVYGDGGLPVWLKDILVNSLYLLTETGYWFQPKLPFGDWAFPQGVFGMNESPRSCPHFSCIPCDWYGGFPVGFFYPDLMRTTLRAFKAYQLETGEIPFSLGRIAALPDLAQPEYHWQCSLNSMCFIDLVDRQWRQTGDDTLLDEFYDAVVRANTYTMNLSTAYGSVISMPDEGGMEWFEHGRWAGMCSHMGGLRLAELKMVERMAEHRGDKAYADRCRAWFTEGSRCMENDLWQGRYYLNYYDKATGEISDDVMAYQLDGEWTSIFHDTGSVFDPARVKTVLETVKELNMKLTPNCGAASFCRPDGSPLEGGADISAEGDNEKKSVSHYGIFSMFLPEVVLLSMTYMYHGQREFGLELLHKSVKFLFGEQGTIWDMPNIIRGDTGARLFGTDYYQDLIFWTVPLALENKGMDTMFASGSLYKRITDAASSGQKRW